MVLLFTLLTFQFPADTAQSDTVRQLNEVRVTGYVQNRPLLETGASVGVLNSRDLQQRNPLPTPVAAFNTLPGVRVEERSPGSYRFVIRGSLLRSPFGVRNVKVYWQGLPLTDAGGNTPLNAFDVRLIGRAEVLKGPAGSLYGANTGGAVLLSGPAVPGGGGRAEVSALGGSYGLFGNSVLLQTGQDGQATTVSYQHLQSDGYRQHSALVRDNVALTSTFAMGSRQTLSALILYSDLRYDTPGGLTAAQFAADPHQARPATRTLPGAAQQRAGIYQRYGYYGGTHEWRPTNNWTLTSALYVTGTDLRNPFITNYERRKTQELGGRFTVQRRAALGAVALVFTGGGEFQRNYTSSRTYGNRAGQPDTLQTDDELRPAQTLAFAQAEAELPGAVIATVGLSYNRVRYNFVRLSVQPNNPQQRGFEPVVLPRFSLLKRFGTLASVFASVSTGYSAPTSQEVLSSNGVFNAQLQPERGVSYEVGLRGNAPNSRLRGEVALYHFALNETIVRRSAENGAEFFVNAGRTAQRGLEAQLQYDLLKTRNATVQAWHSLTLTDFRYVAYQQLSNDLSGNRLPGVAPITAVFGLDATLPYGFYAHATYQFLNPFWLDDANTVRALPTRLLQATAGWRKTFGRWTTDLYAGGDNLLDQTYSLGYDLNAAGARYFNAAPRRNVTAGARVALRW